VLAACSGAVPVIPTDQSPPPANVTRIIIGGDSRNDTSHVLPWAFREAKARGAAAFVFLGDMELTPTMDGKFQRELALLDPIPFYPVIGNHEVKTFGLVGIRDKHNKRRFRERFLDTPRTPVHSAIDGEVVYAVDLQGGVRLIVLDNVSQKGFGDAQLAWLENALVAASTDPRVKHIVVGMHKALAKNGVTTHSMDSDGPRGAADSVAALALFERYKVELVFASHDHRYATFTQGTIRSYITGGLGAPLKGGPGEAFHHFLVLDVANDGLRVDVVPFPGESSFGDEPDDD
jgi:3',5'-cyclic AMP phosphodiesterase CpdA